MLAFADDVLNVVRQLADISLFDVTANLHGLLQFLKIGQVVGEDENGFLIYLGIHFQLLFCGAIVVSSYRDQTQPNASTGRTNEGLVYVLVIGEVILPVLVFLGGIDLSEHGTADALGDLCRIHRGVFDFHGHILFFVGEEGIGIPVAGNVVLRE